MGNYDYQIIIVGAGPAGSICAYQLASRGISVLLVEQEKLPREKPCGGALSIKAEELIDFDISDVIVNKIKTVTFKHGNKKINYNSNKYFTNLVNRSQFDHHLTREACKNGVTLHEGEKVEEIMEVEDGVAVITSKGSYYSKLIIGADGVLSKVTASMELNQQQEKLITYEGDLSVSDTDLEKTDNILIDLDIISDGYGWIFPKKNRLSIGIGQVFKKKIDFKKRFNDFVQEQNLANCQYKYKPRGYLIPAGGKINQIFKGNTLLVGDAAGLVDPLTGEGIYYALRSGIIADEVINDFLAGKSELENYQEKIEEEIGAEFKIASRLSYLFYKFPKLVFNLMEKDREIIELIIKSISGEISYRDFYNNLNKFTLLSNSLRLYLKSS